MNIQFGDWALPWTRSKLWGSVPPQTAVLQCPVSSQRISLQTTLTSRHKWMKILKYVTPVFLALFFTQKTRRAGPSKVREKVAWLSCGLLNEGTYKPGWSRLQRVFPWFPHPPYFNLVFRGMRVYYFMYLFPWFVRCLSWAEGHPKAICTKNGRSIGTAKTFQHNQINTILPSKLR